MLNSFISRFDKKIKIFNAAKKLVLYRDKCIIAVMGVARIFFGGGGKHFFPKIFKKYSKYFVKNFVKILKKFAKNFQKYSKKIQKFFEKNF